MANYNIAAGYNGLKALWKTAANVLSPKGNKMSISPTRIFTGRGSNAYFKFKEVLGAIKAGKLPETFSNDGSGVPEYELIQLPYWENDRAWAACDPGMINDQFGIQLFQSEPVHLEGPNIVLILKHLLRVIVIEQFRNLRETLVKSLVQGFVPVKI